MPGIAQSNAGAPPERGAPSTEASTSESARPRSGARAGFRRHAWLVILPLFAVIYSVSFADRPIIDVQHSVLAEADAANFMMLIRDFELTRTYGDPTRRGEARRVQDNAQKHKIHHTTYAIVAGYSFPVIRRALGWFGVGERRAVYTVNALLTCVNIVLLFFLLARFNPHGNGRGVFVVLYAGALSTWLYGSVPESWPFSGTMILLFLLAFYSDRYPPWALAALIGVAMLNNFVLGSLLVFMAALEVRRSETVRGFLAGLAASTAITFGVWLAGLTVLSLFDPTLRPDRFLAYTLWFRDFVEPGLPLYDPYVWASVVTNLFVNSVVSNQADPGIPQEALKFTLETSRIGLVATLVYLSLMAWVVAQALRSLRARALEAGARPVLSEPGLHVIGYCGAMAGVTLLLYYPGGFLYSTTVVPLLVLLACRFVDMSKRPQAALLYATVALVLMNNAIQVLRFRDALQALS